MMVKEKPKISASTGTDYTKISWVPDLEKFGMQARARGTAGVVAGRRVVGTGAVAERAPRNVVQELDDDVVALFERRAYDMAGCTHSSVKVYLNGARPDSTARVHRACMRACCGSLLPALQRVSHSCVLCPAGKKLQANDFKSYVDLFLGSKGTPAALDLAPPLHAPSLSVRLALLLC